jgi:hypothetical protein
MLNRKLMFSLVALIRFGLFFTLNAFKNSEKDGRHYQYTSNSSSAASIKNIANWEEVEASAPGCDSTGAVVCRYPFDGDMDAFQDFLELSSTTPQYLLEDAEAKKL